MEKIQREKRGGKPRTKEVEKRPIEQYKGYVRLKTSANCDGKLEKWQILKAVIGKIGMGESLQETRDWLQDTFDYSYDSANNIIIQARAALSERLDKWKDKVAEANISRLNIIIDEAYQDGDRANLLKAIDLLNKTCSVYNQNINIQSEQPIFQIRFDNNN